MKPTRRRYSADFRAKFALEAIRAALRRKEIHRIALFARLVSGR
jgi:hypothetical protein